MEIHNLTPHEVKVLDDDGNVIRTFPSVGVARARQTDELVGQIESIPVVKTGFGEVTGLPEPTEGAALLRAPDDLGAETGRAVNPDKRHNSRLR